MRDRLAYVGTALCWFAAAGCADAPTDATRDLPSAGPDLAVASNTWLTRATMPGIERWDVATATVTNAAGQTILYVIGGSIPFGATLGTVHAYNVATNTWTRKADMPAALSSSRAAVINGKIYVAGGMPTRWFGKGPRASLYVYDPAANTWTRKHDMPEAGAGGVAGVFGGKLYVLTTCYERTAAGNFDDCRNVPGGKPGVSYFFRYTPGTDTWARLPSPSHTYNIGAVIDRKLYVVDPDLEVYDPATNRWTDQGESPGDIWGAGVPLGGKLWVVGGTSETGTFVSRFVIYDPATNSWAYRPVPFSLESMAASKVFFDGQARIEVIGAWPRNTNGNRQYIP
jgi:N-acetylneuraminic acid mutarotase